MPEALVITPVKDSLKTTSQTIESVCNSSGDFLYIVYNDFSGVETRKFLDEKQPVLGYELVNLEDLTANPSPNYKLVLQLASKKARMMKVPLIIIESDVVVKKETIRNLIKVSGQDPLAGMVGTATVDENGVYNFPYEYLKHSPPGVVLTNHSLSFCCTLLTPRFLEKFDFDKLSPKKDWFDIYISRQSKKLGFKNYLDKNGKVLHQPHSSRPWKQLKYSNPLKYYFYKYLKNRDRI